MDWSRFTYEDSHGFSAAVARVAAGSMGEFLHAQLLPWLRALTAGEALRKSSSHSDKFGGGIVYSNSGSIVFVLSKAVDMDALFTRVLPDLTEHSHVLCRRRIVVLHNLCASHRRHQISLRNIVETGARTSTFLITTPALGNLDPAILSRCAMLRNVPRVTCIAPTLPAKLVNAFRAVVKELTAENLSIKKYRKQFSAFAAEAIASDIPADRMFALLAQDMQQSVLEREICVVHAFSRANVCFHVCHDLRLCLEYSLLTAAYELASGSSSSSR